MVLTQDFGVDVESIVKSKQVQHEQTMEELRSKRKNMTLRQFKKFLTMPKLDALKLYKEEERGKQ